VRVGVTGASGLIGRSLVAALHERGDTPVTFVRPSSVSMPGLSVRWNPDREEIDDSDLSRVGPLDAVVHLAGAGIGDRRWTPSRKEELMSSRVRSTKSLVEHLLHGDATPFLLSGSAVGWYGTRGEEILDESSTKGDGFLASVCSMWEAEALAYQTSGADVALLRTGVVLSSQGGALKKQLPLFRLGLGGRLGSGDQWMSPISLFDEVRAILWIIDHRLRGPVNLVAPQALTNFTFTRELGAVLRRPTKLVIPRIALDAILGSQMASELLWSSQRVVPRVLESSGFSFHHPSAAQALTWAIRSER